MDTDRFWAQVDRRGDDECWPWLGSLDGGGYGQIRTGGRRVKAHRFAYELLVGPIAEGLVIDHLCRSRSCANPKHLEAVTQGENIRRGLTGATNAAKTHCPHGHEYAAANTYLYRGKRACRACARKRRAASVDSRKHV